MAPQCPEVQSLNILHRSRMAILDHLGCGSSCFDLVARSIGLSPRTLQRRLSVHGLGFTELMEEIRRSQAESLLRQKELPLVEVALALGYSDQTTFSRAFRRWNNCTPGAYRRRVCSRLVAPMMVEK